MRTAKLSPSVCLTAGIIEKLGESATREERATLKAEMLKMQSALGMWVKRCREMEEEIILLKAGGHNGRK